MDVALGQALAHLLQFQLENLCEFVAAKRAEHKNVIKSIEEFRPENLLGFLGQVFLHAGVVLLVVRWGEAHRGTFLEPFRTDVGGQQNDGVAEVHLSPEAVGQFPLLENLKQHVHNVRVRLLNLVKKDDGVGIATHFLGELAAFFVTNVARR